MTKRGFLQLTSRVLRAIGGLFTSAGRNWVRDNMPSMAASLAFHALLSLAPLLLVIVSVFRLLLSTDAIEQQILSQVEQSLGTNAVEGVRMVLQSTFTNPSNAIFIGGGTLLMLLVFSAGFFRQLIHALNVAWKVHEERAGIIGGIIRLIRGHFLAFLMVICIGLYLYASVLVNALRIIPEHALAKAFPAAESLLPQMPRLFFPVILFILFMLLFRVLPARRIAWRDVWPGALVSTVLFIICYRLIYLYLQRAVISSYYGAAGSFIVILLWIYWSAMILLYGAEFAKVYAQRYGTLEKHRSR